MQVADKVVSWLVHVNPEQVIWVKVLLRAIVLCSWTRHYIQRATEKLLLG